MKFSSISVSLLLAASLIMLVCPVGYANILNNSGFENVTGSGTFIMPVGWTDISYNKTWSAVESTWVGSVDGNYAMRSKPTAGVLDSFRSTQTFAPGSYVISGWWRAPCASYVPHIVNSNIVFAMGNSIATYSKLITDAAWSGFMVTLTPTVTTNLTVGIVGPINGASDVEYGVDALDMRSTTADVPETGGLAALVVGFTSLIGFVRRRNN